MFDKFFFVLSLVCVFYFYYTDGGPVEVQKCKGDDAACITASAIQISSAFINGIPEIGLKTMEPLHIDSVDASTDSLLFKIKDADVSGLKSCKLIRIARDVKNSKIIVDSLCNGHLEGQYEINGKVLVIPFQGNGKIIVNLKKLELHIVADIVEKKGKDGKQHWSIKKWNYNYDLKDKSDVKFENLFPNNKVLAQAAGDVLSQSGNEIIHDIGEPVIKSIISEVVERVQKFFKRIPIEDLAIP